MKNRLNAKGDILLGKKTQYNTTYNYNILTAIPRSLNREEQGISNDMFVGYDVWHAYEASCLYNNGLPYVGIMKIIVPCNSDFLVESKSLKLYLNGFNNEKLGNNYKSVKAKFVEIVQQDLCQLLETEVRINLFESNSSNKFDFNNYKNIDKVSDTKLDYNTKEDKYSLLKVIKTPEQEINISSFLLRSNCRVTGQPDWGNIYIHMKGVKMPNTDNLVQYLTSLRNENHFHEEICEQIYADLATVFTPSELAVTCLYTRRGGIDICPVRVSNSSLLPLLITDHNVLSKASFRQ